MIVTMTPEEHRRLTAALTEKIRRMGELELEEVIGVVVADTALICEGITMIEQYEAGD